MGLGNPGLRYINTRHNIGFTILDSYAFRHNLEFNSRTETYYFTESLQGQSPFLLVKPITYVNLSGIAAKHILDKYDISPPNLLVITDDVNLELGKIRFRSSGGDGGHNGLNSIIYHLQSEDFPRIRIGIGDDFENGNLANYVLGKIDEPTLTKLEPQFEHAIRMIEEFISGDIRSLLNYYSTITLSDSTNKFNHQDGKQEA